MNIPDKFDELGYKTWIEKGISTANDRLYIAGEKYQLLVKIDKNDFFLCSYAFLNDSGQDIIIELNCEEFINLKRNDIKKMLLDKKEAKQIEKDKIKDTEEEEEAI